MPFCNFAPDKNKQIPKNMTENVNITSSIFERLERIEKFTMLGAKSVLTLEEVSLFTGLSKARLYTLTAKREIPHYKNGKLYFVRSEIEQWLTRYRVATNEEIQSNAVAHTMGKPVPTHL